MTTERTTDAGRFDALWCGLVAFAVYAALQQRTLYAADAHGFLLATAKGGLSVHPHHFAYLPALALARELGERLGLSVYTAAVLLSAFGTAVGVGLAHAANRRLGLSRPLALLATGLCAATPAVMFFATVVEVHGLHFGCCGLSFLATAIFVQRPSPARGALLGFAMAAGFAGHATGVLLPALIVPLALAWSRERGTPCRGAFGDLALATLVHFAVVLALPRTLQALGYVASSDGAAAVLMQHLLALMSGPGVIVATLWRDWLWPFLPLAAITPLLLLVRSQRAAVLAVLLCTGIYVAISAALFVPFVDHVQVTGHGSERGAYLLPLAWPMGYLAVRCLGAKAVPVLLAGAALAIYGVMAHDQRPQRAFADGLRTVAADRPVFVIAGGHDEVAAFLVDLPQWRAEVHWQQLLFLDGLPAEQLEPAWQAYDAWLRQKHGAAIELWITAGAIMTLTDPGWTKGRPAGPFLLARLRADYRWTERREHGFVGWSLVPNPR